MSAADLFPPGSPLSAGDRFRARRLPFLQVAHAVATRLLLDRLAGAPRIGGPTEPMAAGEFDLWWNGGRLLAGDHRRRRTMELEPPPRGLLLLLDLKFSAGDELAFAALARLLARLDPAPLAMTADPLVLELVRKTTSLATGLVTWTMSSGLRAGPGLLERALRRLGARGGPIAPHLTVDFLVVPRQVLTPDSAAAMRHAAIPFLVAGVDRPDQLELARSLGSAGTIGNG